MKGKFVQESFTGMPMWAKGVIGILVTGVAIYVGYKVYKGFKVAKENQGANQQNQATTDELVQLQSQGQKPTLTKVQQLALANKMFTAMDGYGTDKTTLFQALVSIPTYLDLLGVMQAYGVREISSGTGNPEPNFKGTLSAALVSELSTADLQAINMVLAKKGIKFKF